MGGMNATMQITNSKVMLAGEESMCIAAIEDALIAPENSSSFSGGGWNMQDSDRRTKMCRNHGREREQKRLREEACRRRKDDQLKKTLGQCNNLPHHLQANVLNTAWVSPAMDRLAPSDGFRKLLRKPRGESTHVAMQSPSEGTLLPIVRASTPSSQHSRQQIGMTPAPRSQSAAGVSTSSSGAGGAASTAVVAGSGGTGGLGGCSGAGGSSPALIVEPPQRVGSELVERRLEEQRRVFNENSFRTYMKEYDIFTGGKKSRIDPERLAREEKIYVQRLYDLVGKRGSRAYDVRNSPLYGGRNSVGGTGLKLKQQQQPQQHRIHNARSS